MDASLSRVIRRFFHKTAQVIVQARDLPPGTSAWTGKTDKWFSLESEELIAVRDLMTPWHGDGFANGFPPLIVEMTVSASHLTKQRIVLEEGGKRYPTDKQEVVLERWVLEWQPRQGDPAEIAVVYKRAVVALRCLFSLLRILPTWSLRQKIHRQKTPLKLGFRIIEGTSSISSRGRVGLKHKIGPEKDPAVYQFAPVESSAGALQLSVTYRSSANFKTEDTETIIARQLMEQGDIDRPRSTSSSVTSLGSVLRPVVSFTRPFKNSEIPRRNTSSTNIYQSDPVPVPVPAVGPSSLGQSSSTTSSAPRFSSSFARSNARLRSVSGTGSTSSHSSYEPGSVYHHSEVSEFLRFVDDTQRKANAAFNSESNSLQDSSLSRFQLMRSSSLGDSIAQIEASAAKARASVSPPPVSQSPLHHRRYSHLPAHPSRLNEQIARESAPHEEEQKLDEDHLDEDKLDDDLVFAFKV